MRITSPEARCNAAPAGRKVVFYLIAFALFPTSLSHPIEASSGTEGASFLDIPVGAAPASLGSAYSARAADAYAPVWNPAGLGFLNGVGVSATHLSYLQSIHYEYLGAVIPFGKLGGSSEEPPLRRMGLGMSVQYLGSGNIPGYSEDNVPTGSFSTTFAAYSLAYGQALTDRWAMGLTGKAITESIADASARAYAADVGTLYKINDRLSLAGVAANMGSSVQFVSEKDPLPLAFRTGIYYQFFRDLNLSAETVYRRTGLFSGSAGVEWTYADKLMLRGGFDTSHARGLSGWSMFTGGVGVHFLGQDFSLAWVPFSDLGNAYYFSLDLHFGAAARTAKPNLKSVVAEGEPSSTEGSGDYQELYQMLSDDERKALPKPQSADKRESE